MTLAGTIVLRNPKGAKKFLGQYGVSAKNPQDAVLKINNIISKKGDPALKELVSIHPDRELILENYSNACGSCQFSNCSGNGNCSCSKMSNADGAEKTDSNGTPIPSASLNFLERNQTLLITAGAIALIVYILKK
jgi:hypothetical protein